MRISLATWNVNSIRARLSAVTEWIEKNRPDILCLQELKVEEEKFPAEPFTEMGYSISMNAQKTWNGVATLSKFPITDIRKGFISGFLSEQKRFLHVETAGILVINVYVPQGGDPFIEKFQHKLSFLEELKRELEQLASSDKPGVIVGDMNVALGNIDVFDPEILDGQVGFHPDERKRLNSLISAGFTDLFRKFSPDEKAFSWWDYRSAAFRRNMGMRLDLILSNQSLTELATSCTIDIDPRKKEKPSDHTPVIAVFDFPEK